MHILEALFQARDPHALADWYEATLGLPRVEYDGLGAEDAAVLVGQSALRFTPAPVGERPVYHFAFDIAQNKFGKARRWLRERGVEALRDANTGEPYVYFKRWNARSVYFDDAGGNIVEFIARHNNEDATTEGGAFTEEDVLWISEVGFVVDDVPGAVLDLKRRLQIEPWTPGSEDFAAVGDEDGMLIVVPRGHAWLPDLTRKAQAFPTRVTVEAGTLGRVGFAAAGGVQFEVALTPGEGSPGGGLSLG